MSRDDTIIYRLSRDGQPIAEYVSRFDEKYSVIVSDGIPGEWARLENCQCTNCPYSNAERKYCPVALTIGEILFAVDDGVSTDVVLCEVSTSVREYRCSLPYQKAISSLIGLRMATSGCSKFAFLKPMARMHLPFATLEETIVRNSAFFLFGGFFANPKASIESRLDELTDNFRELAEVNKALISRVRSTLKKGDIHRNAMIVLDSFSQVLSMGERRGSTFVKDLLLEHHAD